MELIILKTNFFIDGKLLYGDGGIAFISAIGVIIILLFICLIGFVYYCRFKRRGDGKVLQLEMHESYYKQIEEETNRMYWLTYWYVYFLKSYTDLWRNLFTWLSNSWQILSYSQKQPQEVFCKKSLLKNLAKFTGKHLQSLFFNKVAGIKPATLLKKRLWHRCFPVNLAKFLRISFLWNTSWRLLLIDKYCSHFSFYSKKQSTWRKDFIFWPYF